MKKTKKTKKVSSRPNFFRRFRFNRATGTAFIVVILVAAIGGYYAVKQTHAATNIGYICLSYAGNQCLKSNGPYNTETICNIYHCGDSKWTEYWTGYVANHVTVEFQDEGGHCLRMMPDYTVTVGESACDSSADYQKWAIYYNSDGSRSYKNVGYWGYNGNSSCCFMFTKYTSDGSRVFTWQPQSGEFIHWVSQ